MDFRETPDGLQVDSKWTPDTVSGVYLDSWWSPSGCVAQCNYLSWCCEKTTLFPDHVRDTFTSVRTRLDDWDAKRKHQAALLSNNKCEERRGIGLEEGIEENEERRKRKNEKKRQRKQRKEKEMKAVHVVNLVYHSTASITSIKCTTDSSLQRL